MVNALIPWKPPLDRPLARCRQWSALVALAALAGLAMLAGCAPGDQRPGGGLPTDPAFAGAVAADEPHAVLAAREVLAAGGSAADAAAALTFALAVTYPSAASLGGGGQCLVYARGEDEDRVASLDFLPGRQAPPAGGGRAIAVPGTVRGMDALQARYGRLRWSQTLVAAERLAGLGHPASRALVARSRDRRRSAVPRSGRTLSLRRARRRADRRGPNHRPTRSRRTARAAAPRRRRRVLQRPHRASPSKTPWLARAGCSMPRRWSATGRAGAAPCPCPSATKSFTRVPGAGGAVAAAIWALAGADGRYGEAGAAGRARLLADAVLRGFASPPASAEGALDSASLAPGTRGEGTDEGTAPGGAGARLGAVPTTSLRWWTGGGMAVACGLTMNGLFGAGKVAPGTGIVLAAAPEPALPPPLAPVVLVNRNSRQVFLAAGAGGGEAAPSALGTVLLELLDGERPLGAALAAPRLHRGGAPGGLTVEPALDAAARSALAERGHRAVEVAAIGRVNAIHCPDGLPRSPESCRYASDPAASGSPRREPLGAGPGPRRWRHPGGRRSRPSLRWKSSRPPHGARQRARRSSTWKPASPVRVRPQPSSMRRGRCSPREGSAIPRPTAYRRCASVSPYLTGSATASPRRPSASWSRPGAPPGSCSPSSPRSIAATGWRSPIPAIPPTATRCAPSAWSRLRCPPRRRPAFSRPWRCWRLSRSRSRA